MVSLPMEALKGKQEGRQGKMMLFEKKVTEEGEDVGGGASISNMVAGGVK